MHFIYALTDPRTDAVAYVGITSNAYERFKQHIGRRGANGKKHIWILQLQNEKVMPAMRILETVETEEVAREREEYWIRYYTERGTQLANLQHYASEQTHNEKPGKSRATTRVQAGEEKGGRGKRPISSPANLGTAEKLSSERKRSVLNEARGLCYTTGEAMEKLKVPRHVFNHMVKRGEVPRGVRIPLRKQALYRKADIDRLVEERERFLDGLN
jgi:predicted GIY-YIG superfamily endonuclease